MFYYRPSSNVTEVPVFSSHLMKQDLSYILNRIYYQVSFTLTIYKTLYFGYSLEGHVSTSRSAE